MSLHDLVRGGEIVESREFDETPTLAANKGAWLPRYYPNPDFEAGPGERKRLDITIEADRVVYAYSGEALPLDEIQAPKRAEIDAAYFQRFTSPFPWDFGSVTGKDDDQVDTGALGAQTLQMRFDPANGVDDMKNWIAVASTLAILPDDEIAPMKTSANLWAQVTVAQAKQVLAQGDGSQTPMFARQAGYLARYGALKKALAAAGSDLAAIDAIDPTSGW